MKTETGTPWGLNWYGYVALEKGFGDYEWLSKEDLLEMLKAIEEQEQENAK